MITPVIHPNKIVMQNAVNLLKLLDTKKISTEEAEELAKDNLKNPEKVRGSINAKYLQ